MYVECLLLLPNHANSHLELTYPTYITVLRTRVDDIGNKIGVELYNIQVVLCDRHVAHTGLRSCNGNSRC